MISVLIQSELSTIPWKTKVFQVYPDMTIAMFMFWFANVHNILDQHMDVLLHTPRSYVIRADANDTMSELNVQYATSTECLTMVLRLHQPETWFEYIHRSIVQSLWE